MDSQTYFDRMRETSDAVDGIIFETLAPLRLENQGMYDAVMALPNKRRGLPKSRAHLAREAYTTCKGIEDEGWVPLAATVELELNSMYYKNQVFDEKAGHSIRNRKSAFGNWIADSYSRDVAGKLLQEAYHNRPQVSELLRQANMICTEGFWLDIFQNTYRQTKEHTFDEQIGLCDARMYRMNASFCEKIAKMGAIAAHELDDSRISALADFGKAYGMGLQSVNDLADFVPPRLNAGTTEKTGDDAYRDVILGKMTYPTIWLLHNGTEEEKSLVHGIFQKGQETPLTELEDLSRTLVDSGAIAFAQGKIRGFRNEARRAVHRSFSKEERAYLSSMCTMFTTNRYGDALKYLTSE